MRAVHRSLGGSSVRLIRRRAGPSVFASFSRVAQIDVQRARRPFVITRTHLRIQKRSRIVPCAFNLILASLSHHQRTLSLELEDILDKKRAVLLFPLLPIHPLPRLRHPSQCLWRAGRWVVHQLAMHARAEGWGAENHKRRRSLRSRARCAASSLSLRCALAAPHTNPTTHTPHKNNQQPRPPSRSSGASRAPSRRCGPWPFGTRSGSARGPSTPSSERWRRELYFCFF